MNEMNEIPWEDPARKPGDRMAWEDLVEHGVPRGYPYRFRRASREQRIEDALADAIRHANWFPEQDTALTALAHAGQSEQIRAWADYIETQMPECAHSHQTRSCNDGRCCGGSKMGWPRWFCRRVARLWRRVARLVA